MKAIEQLVNAWENSGSHPPFHDRMKRKLQREWPVLAEAIQALVDEQKHGES
jgi:hypothetical protein